MTDIMVFDDSRTVRMFVEMTLSQHGYAVDTFYDLRTLDKGSPRPKLVLLDVHMDEFFGTDLLAHIRQLWSDPPRIYLYSEMAEAQLEQTVEDSGADGYISKSWGYEGLVDAVRDAIGGDTGQCQ